MDKNIQTVMQLTGSDFKTAKYYLDASGNNVNGATSLFFDNKKRSPIRKSSGSGSGSGSSSKSTNTSNPNEIRKPDEAKVSNLFYDRESSRGQNPYIQHMSYMGGRGRGRGRGFLGGIPSSILGGLFPKRNNPPRKVKAKKKAPNKITDDSRAFSKLFAPPQDLMHIGSFNKTMEYASKKKKFLLCNVQSFNCFDALKLNRDTWSNDNLKKFIKKNFVFWQVEIDTVSGREFRALYMTGIYKFPFISIIDPRTGEDMIHVTKYMDAKEMRTWLDLFLLKNDFDETSDGLNTPTPKPRGEKNDFDFEQFGLQKNEGTTQVDATEQQLLDFVMRESLKSNVKKKVDDMEVDMNEMLYGGGGEKKKNEKEKEEKKDLMDVDEKEDVEKIVEKIKEEEVKKKDFADIKVTLSQWIAAHSSVENCTSVRLNLPNGKREVVYLKKNAPLAAIYAAFRARLSEEEKGKDFTVVLYNRKIENILEKTLKDENIERANLSISFD